MAVSVRTAIELENERNNVADTKCNDLVPNIIHFQLEKVPFDLQFEP